MTQQVVENSGSTGSSSGAEQGSLSRSKLVQRLQAANDSLPQFINDLLTTQAVSVAGTEAAAFVIERGPQGEPVLRPIAHMRPDNSTEEIRNQAIKAFQEFLEPCVLQGKDGAVEVTPPGDMGEAQFCLITLLKADGNAVAVSAVVTRCADRERARQRLMSMQLIAGYFDLYNIKQNQARSRAIVASHQSVLQMVSSVSTADGFNGAAANLVNEFAQRTGATRVSVGWLKGRQIRVKAISHTEKFDRRQELVVQLENVMEECFDQDVVVQYETNGAVAQAVTRAAAELAKQGGASTVVSLPLRRRGDPMGVVTLEFGADIKLNEEMLHGLTVAADLLASQLFDRHENDRWLITKAGVSAKNFGEGIMGPKYMIGKLIAVIGLAVLAVLIFYKPMDYISAPFEFVPVEKRVVCAPFEGFIGEVPETIREGNDVKAGDVLMTMRTEELEIKRAQAHTRANGFAKEAAKHKAERKYADEKIALAQRDEALEEVRFIDDQIEKSTLRAPIDGRILVGDLKDRIGTPVKLGDVLFEIGDPTKLEAEISVAERDIQEMNTGTREGELATTSLPGDKFKFKVKRVVSLGTPDAKEMNNVFKVYATLDEQNESWYPRLAGEARINTQHRALGSIWTRKVVDYVRLKLWI